MDQVERRSQKRYSIRLSAEVVHQDRLFTAVTRDLSLGGVALEVDRTLATGSRVAVTLFLVTEDIEDPSFPTLELRGTVAWSTPPSPDKPALAGVRFESLRAEDTAMLQRLIRATA